MRGRLSASKLGRTIPSSSDTREFLFVYGTLRVGFDNPYARELRKRATFVESATLPEAVLVDLGSYPGLIPGSDPDSSVRGDLFELPRSHRERRALLARLDAYEGCSTDPERPGEYVREKRPVLTSDGGTVSAWTYHLNRPAAGLPLVPEGDYLG